MVLEEKGAEVRRHQERHEREKRHDNVPKVSKSIPKPFHSLSKLILYIMLTIFGFDILERTERMDHIRKALQMLVDLVSDCRRAFQAGLSEVMFSRQDALSREPTIDTRN